MVTEQLGPSMNALIEKIFV